LEVPDIQASAKADPRGFLALISKQYILIIGEKIRNDGSGSS